jgi:hypothetical protein
MAGTPGAIRKDGSKPLYYRCPSNATFDCNRPCDLPFFLADQVDAVIWNWVRGLFEDEKLFEAAIRRYLERSEEETAPLKERLEETDVLIAEKEEELAQAQQDYRSFKDSSADRTKATIMADIERLEMILDDLESRRETVKTMLAQAALSETEIQTIRKYADEVREGLDIANARFEEQRWLIEKLDVKATLTVEDGQRIAYVECRLGEKPERLEIKVLLLSCTS